jgi:hypothetical protein
MKKRKNLYFDVFNCIIVLGVDNVNNILIKIEYLNEAVRLESICEKTSKIFP